MFPFRRVFVADFAPAFDADLLYYAAGVAALGSDTEVILAPLSGAHPLHALETARFIFAARGVRRVSCTVLVDPGVEDLLSAVAEAKADLLLMRHPGDVRGGHTLARTVMAASPCSVWFVPEGGAPEWRHVAVEVGSPVGDAQLLPIACALGRRAGAELLSAIHVTVATTLEKIEEFRQQKQFEMQCMMARLDVGDMECAIHVDEGAFLSRTLQRTARHKKADLLVTASRVSDDTMGGLARWSEMNDLVCPGASALLGVHLPQARPTWRQTLRRFFSSPEPTFS